MRIPLSLHEDLVERHHQRDPATGAVIEDPALDALAQGMKTARAAAEQLVSVVEAVSADKTATPEARAAKVRKLALQVGERAGAALDKARDAAAAEIAEIEAATAAPESGDEQIESEIRARLASMSHDDRAKVVTEAIANDDSLTLAAIFRPGVPAWLSGHGTAELELRRHAWRKKKFPAQLNRLERLAKALSATETGGRAFVSMVKKLADDPEAAAAEAAAARAAEAVRAIEATEAA